MRKRLRSSSIVFAGFAGIFAMLALTGCHSHIVVATIANQGPAVRLIEFDYPSASFGTDQIAAGSLYHYRFKIQGSGPLTLSFQDSAGKPHTMQGPTVHQGQEGSLLVTIEGQGSKVTWTPQLK
jgi:hypothetical protein